MTRNSAAITRGLLHALRHAPEQYNLELDAQGWTSLEDVVLALNCSRADCVYLQVDGLRRFVDTRLTDRIEIVGERIRARYGHSVALVGAAVAAQPPPLLFHGTDASVLTAIREHGLRPMGRRRVHLTSDMDYAREVAGAKGDRSVVLEVITAPACEVGVGFYVATAHVWLADSVPPQFICFPRQAISGRKCDTAGDL